MTDTNDPGTEQEDVDLGAAFEAIGGTTPLIDAITNNVTINGVANTILHWGGLPVMAENYRDVRDMVATSEGLLLNLGDVSERGEATMIEAGRAANDCGVPIVLDPVGMGSTPTRIGVVEHLIDDLDIAIINGNRAEIGAIAGDADSEIRGVESVGEGGDATAATLACARETGATVVASGETDVISDGEAVYAIAAGDSMMGQVVGTGCMLGGTLAVFAASLDDSLDAALAGTLSYGIAGEQAGSGEYGEYHGPASYETAFRDAMAGFEPADTDRSSTRVERIVSEE